MPKVASKTIPYLSASGPDGMTLAKSYDGGQTWQPTPEGLDYELRRSGRQGRTFTRRIAAVIEAPSPMLERRIGIPFAELHEAEILAGWAPYAYLSILEPNSLDAIVLTDLQLSDEQIAKLKRVAPLLMLDLDDQTSLREEARADLDRILPQVESVTVSNSLMATRIHPYHARVFAQPELIRLKDWTQFERMPYVLRQKVNVGIPYDMTDALGIALETLSPYYGDRVNWIPLDPRPIGPQDDAKFYAQYDVVCLPPPKERHQVGTWRVVPPMMAECAVLADRTWPILLHDQTGLHIGRDTPQAWGSTLQRAINDSRLRIRLGRNAKAQAKRWTPEAKRTNLILPYRLNIPKGRAVKYV